MMLQKKTALIVPAILLFTHFLAGCSRFFTKPDTETYEASDTSPKLAEELSKLQSRIEELDAKLAGLSDKLESTKTIVDNIAGVQPTQTVQLTPSLQEVPAASSHAAPNLPPSKGNVIGDFRQAMSLYKQGKWSEAQLAFHQVTEQFPDHPFAGSAQFFAGDSYFQMGEYQLAVNDFEKVLQSFSSSPRVASALLKLSQCHEKLGNKQESEKMFKIAQKLFADSPLFKDVHSITNDLQPSPIDTQ